MKINDEIKKDLKRLVWDYDISEAELAEIFLGKTSTFSLNREKLCARLLISTSWYRMLDHFGVQGVKEMLTDEVIRHIWIKDLREKFLYAKAALYGIG